MTRNSKEYWVKYILEQDTENLIIEKEPVEKLANEWFSSSNATDFLRLSEKGKSCFDLVLKEYFDFEITHNRNSYMSALYYLHLGKKLEIPFYVHFVRPKTIIRIYDKKIAIVISLHGGIQEYLGK